MNDLQQFLGVVVIFSGSYYNSEEAPAGNSLGNSIKICTCYPAAEASPLPYPPASCCKSWEAIGAADALPKPPSSTTTAKA